MTAPTNNNFRVKNGLVVGNGSTCNAYTLPTLNGGSGTVITSNGDGTTAWTYSIQGLQGAQGLQGVSGCGIQGIQGPYGAQGVQGTSGGGGGGSGANQALCTTSSVTFNSINLPGILNTTTFISAISGTTTATISSYYMVKYSGSKHTVLVQDNNNVQSEEINIVNDGTNTWMIEYGINTTNGPLGTFSVTTGSSSLINLVYTTTATNMNITSNNILFAVNVNTYGVDYLIVGGGGGGAYRVGGGGGAGGLLTGRSFIAPGNIYNIVVGAGGTGGTSGTGSGGNGGNSTFNNLTAIGGGGGGTNFGGGSVYYPPGNGGSGGGGSDGEVTSGNPGLGTTGQGNDGGAGIHGVAYAGGGGGGAGSAGTSPSSSVGGNGGNGLQSNITGSCIYYAGGGGGGYYPSGHHGLGGSGGGGDGSGSVGCLTTPGPGTVNTGGGGGGGGYAGFCGYPGANGGSGVVILSIPTINYSGVSTGSPTVTTSGSNTILKYTANGSYTA